MEDLSEWNEKRDDLAGILYGRKKRTLYLGDRGRNVLGDAGVVAMEKGIAIEC